MRMPDQDSSVLLSERDLLETSSEQKSFSEFYRFHRKQVKDASGKVLTTKNVALQLGISPEMLKKIVNKNKPTKKRDCIIAICAVLRLDAEETTDALHRYCGFPGLDTDDPREDLLFTILEEQFENMLTIDEINNRLKQNGFSELDIIDHKRHSKRIVQEVDSRYKLLAKKVRITSEDYLFDSPYDALDYEYSPSRYCCVAEMLLSDKKTGKKFRLGASTRDSLWLCDEETPVIKSVKSIEDIDDLKEVYPDLETNDLKEYYSDLKAVAKHEIKKMYGVLNDTRNYGTRVSAGIRGDALHVYAETFNTTAPETGEYYLFEYMNGETLFSVYKSSQFMHCYLQSDEYTSIYGDYSDIPIASYRSKDEVLKDRKTCICDEHVTCRCYYFDKLKGKADTLLSDIREKGYTRNIDSIYDNRFQVCQFFKVEEEYCCVEDGEYGEIVAQNDTFDFSFEGVGTVTITLKELFRAFELGFNDMYEICRVKQKLGSIEKIIR